MFSTCEHAIIQNNDITIENVGSLALETQNTMTNDCAIFSMAVHKTIVASWEFMRVRMLSPT